MALAFTKEQEKEIVSRLKKAAQEGIAKAGMRKTTVDTLVQAAGISKGAFYKFYTSKELLFFELLEDLHTEVYTIAAGVLVENAALPPVERTAKAVLAACRIMGESKLLAFAALEATDLLRSIPHEVLEEHYHSDEVHIRALLEEAGLKPEGGMELAAATVRGLMLTLSLQPEIGSLYPQVLETLVYGSCARLFPCP